MFIYIPMYLILLPRTLPLEHRIFLSRFVFFSNFSVFTILFDSSLSFALSRVHLGRKNGEGVEKKKKEKKRKEKGPRYRS